MTNRWHKVAIYRGARGLIGPALALLLILGGGFPGEAPAAPLYAPPSIDDTQTRVLEWTATQKIADPRVTERIASLWKDVPADLSPRQVFDRVIETFRTADIEARRFIDACDLARPPLVPPDPSLLLKKHAGDDFFVAHLRLYFARYLAQRSMYEEALAVFHELDPAAVVDPATCLFFRAVCEHQLLQRTEGLATLDNLLQNTQQVPEPYAGLAKLMEHDLKSLEEDPLGTVSRMMRDSERRLDLGRGGQKVQKVQDEIVAALDELIKKAEQQNSGGGEGTGRNNTNRSDAPAADSTIKGATAPGEVDPKEFKKQGGWGALPPKEEARAKNLLNQEFPAHYRQAVEQYFKKLATRRAPTERQP